MDNTIQKIAKIDKNIYLGSCFSVDPKILQENNIKYVFHIGFEIVEPILKNEYVSKNVKREHFVVDDDVQSASKMMDIGRYICDRINQIDPSNNILVCCVAGRSRSASVIVRYLHNKYTTLTYDEIIAYINKQRETNINRGFENELKKMFV
jgi:hypothetical protein